MPVKNFTSAPCPPVWLEVMVSTNRRLFCKALGSLMERFIRLYSKNTGASMVIIFIVCLLSLRTEAGGSGRDKHETDML